MKLPVWVQYKDDDAHAQARGAHLSPGAGCTSQSLGRGDDGSTRTRTKKAGKGGERKHIRQGHCVFPRGWNLSEFPAGLGRRAREMEKAHGTVPGTGISTRLNKTLPVGKGRRKPHWPHPGEKPAPFGTDSGSLPGLSQALLPLRASLCSGSLRCGQATTRGIML